MKKKCNTGNYCREFTGGLSMINEIYKTNGDFLKEIKNKGDLRWDNTERFQICQLNWNTTSILYKSL